MKRLGSGRHVNKQFTPALDVARMPISEQNPLLSWSEVVFYEKRVGQAGVGTEVGMIRQKKCM